jgi:hypothetical protein
VSAPPAPILKSDPAERYAARIEEHRTRLVGGHDPFGHLFAIERLARAARAESWASRPPSEPVRREP